MYANITTSIKILSSINLKTDKKLRKIKYLKVKVKARSTSSNGGKKRNYTIHVAKTKALISFAVTAKLICAFVFAYAK